MLVNPAISTTTFTRPIPIGLRTPPHQGEQGGSSSSCCQGLRHKLSWPAQDYVFWLPIRFFSCRHLLGKSAESVDIPRAEIARRSRAGDKKKRGDEFVPVIYFNARRDLPPRRAAP